MEKLLSTIGTWFSSLFGKYPFSIDIVTVLISMLIVSLFMKYGIKLVLMNQFFKTIISGYIFLIKKIKFLSARNLLIKVDGLTNEVKYWFLFLITYLGLVFIGRLLEFDIKYVLETIVIVAVWNLLKITFAIFKEDVLSDLLKYLIIILFSLHYLKAYDPTIKALDKIGYDIGNYQLSLFVVLKGFVVFVVLLFATVTISKYVEKRIFKLKTLKPSFKVLVSKVIKIMFVTFIIIITIESIGLDITTLTVFSGALGLGLGFGLQKILSNLVSGLILLGDSSIKPGDVIAIGETYGWVNSIGGRYVSIITRDGKEHLVPNELLITEKVENWSFTNENVRVRIPINVSYKSDIRKVIALVLEAAQKTERVLDTPQPNCLLRGFGESSVDLELRVWINDPINGMGNIQSELLLNVWDIFKENNIEIPYPQRDLHIKDQITISSSEALFKRD